MITDHWDEWSGDLYLKGLDPREWDLHRLLGAFETSLRQGSENPAEWKKTERSIYAPPRHVLEQQRAERRNGAVRPRTEAGRGRMSVSSAESLVARLNAADTRHNAK